ncbi:MFS transporter [Kutzneria albida]|nr:MFS transporter [Kutzneria albida]
MGVAMSRRWLILALGLLAQASASAFVYGIAFLVPDIRAVEGLSLAETGVIVSAPTVGLLLTLIAWGAAADRFGERVVMALGLGLAGVLLLVGTLGLHGVTPLVVVLVLAGAGSASVNAASGRVVMGWFGPEERGLAMGIRQTAQPVGVGIAALSLPLLSQHFGYRTALVFPAVLCVVVAVLVAVLVQDPPRPAVKPGERARSPYRQPALWRVHGASTLLVVPQFVISAFSLDYLVSVLHWTPGAAGGFLGAVQAAGAGGRIVTGVWADRVGSRLRPMRQLAVASALVMGLLALGDLAAPWLVVTVIAVGAVITVADNGLGFTAAAELAGSSWAGRALGAQNTAQNIAAALTPPMLGLLIGGTSYAVGFLTAAVFPLLAVLVTPVSSERISAYEDGPQSPGRAPATR